LGIGENVFYLIDNQLFSFSLQNVNIVISHKSNSGMHGGHCRFEVAGEKLFLFQVNGTRLWD